MSEAAKGQTEEPAEAHGKASDPITLDLLQEIGMRAVLSLARRQFLDPGPRERAIREELGISPTRYFQVLRALLDSHEALAIDPATVNRLNRLLETRREAREGGRRVIPD